MPFFVIKCILAVVLMGAFYLILRKRLSIRYRLIVVACVLWAGFFSYYLSDAMPHNNEWLYITATGMKNELSAYNQLILSGYAERGIDHSFDRIVDGFWPHENKGGSNDIYFFWLSEGAKQWTEEITPSVAVLLPVGTKRELILGTGPNNGIADVVLAGEVQRVDTYAGALGQVRVLVPDTGSALLHQDALRCFGWFAFFYAFLAALVAVTMYLVLKETNAQKFRKYKFLFEELVKRDFMQKYKRTFLGMVWSVMSPLCTLVILWIVFGKILGSTVKHFPVYLFAGQLVFSYFSEATTFGMSALLDNAGIFTKVNVPKYMFIFSKNISSLFNFALTLLVFFVFTAFEGLPFTGKFLMLLYPLICLIGFNIGLGLILSALLVFFRDVRYLWGIFTQMIMYVSAIFYPIDRFDIKVQSIFLLNPIYLFIRYFRKIIIDGEVPAVEFHLLMAGYTVIAFAIGCYMYRRYNQEFLYYV
jgi:ABC-2 type transport system permease protein